MRLPVPHPLPGNKPSRMELVIFTGLQGAGKSTYYRAYLSQSHIVVSKDLMRNKRNREARQQRLIREALCAGQSVVVDNTNPTRALREPLIALGHELGACVVSV